MAVSQAANFLIQGNNQLQKEALELFQSLQDSPDGWRMCIEALKVPQDETRIFFCLLVIESYVKNRYEDDSSDNQTTLKHFVVHWFTYNDHSCPTFILNKFAQIIGSLFVVDFPSGRWFRFFQDFISICHSDVQRLIFLKILQSINAEIADTELNRTQKEIDRGTLIKDIMRDHSIRDIAKFWITLLDMSDKVSPAVIRLCLDVIGSYVAWIDISLITNDCLMSKLFALFTLDDFRCSVCDCFAGVLRKGMDPLAKTSLIEQFLAVDAIKQKLHAIINCNSEDDQEFLIKLSRLMNTIGLELILSFKKVKSKVSIQPTLEVSLKVLANAIDDKFPLLCYFLGHQKHIVCYQIHPFAREYIQWIKSNRILSSSSSTSTSTVSSSCTSNSKQVEIPLIETISPDRVKEIISIFTRIIVSTCKYNETIYTSQLCDDLAFDEFRKSCKVIFENLIGLNHTYCCNIVCSTLIQNELTKIPSTIEPFDIEVSLYMFYLLGENINLITSVREIESILSLIITSNISSLAFPPVQILYFEIVNRYEKLYATSLINYIPQILVSFVDERGLKSKDTFVRSKVCSLFNKFIKNTLRGKAVGKINEFSEEIITRLQEFLTLDVSNILSHHQTTDVRLNEEDQLLLYETVSCLIISNVSYDPVKKHMLLKSFLLSPLWTDYDHLYSSLVSRLPATTNGSHYVQVKNAFSNTTGATSASNGTNNSFSDPIIDAICLRVAHSINLVARISKAFSNVHTLQSIQGQGLFLDSFNTFSKVLSLSSIGDDNLIVIQSALRQLLHRLVVCLEEAEILPLLPIAIEKVFLTFSGAYFTEKSVQELIPLLSQVVTKFKNSWMFQRDLLPFLKQMVTPLLSSLYTLINDANELYDDKKQALQKSYYAFLSVLAVNNAIEVLTVLDPLAFQSVTDTVVKGTVNSDVATQKICFSILRKLIECQCSISSESNEDKWVSLSGVSFVDFMYKNIVPACFYGLSKANCDVPTSEVNALINEVILCLKAVSSSRPQGELSCFLQNFLPQHFPEFPSDQLIQALASNDQKPAKECLRAFAGRVKREPIEIV